MATIQTTISLFDGVSSPLRTMHKTLGTVISAFESMQDSSGKAVNTDAVRDARAEWARAGVELDRVEQNIKDADIAQKKLNGDINGGTNAAGSLLDKVKSIAGAYAGIQGVKKALSWVSDTLDAANTQTGAETQLKTVLANVGAAEDAFDRISAKASEIQSKGIYGDEAMLGGAAELATYISDAEALESMMGTLANYAAGMSGGGELDYTAMVDYATQLGKALDGTFDGITKKGFELTDEQKQIIENGTDMEKALVMDEVISQSWEGLYETMSRTPESRIIQLKNSWGDLMETLGNKLYPVVLEIVDTVQARWPEIESVMDGVAGAAGTLVAILGTLLNVGIGVANGIVSNWSFLRPVIMGVAAAMLIYNGYLAVSNTLTAISNMQKGIAAVKTYALAAASLTMTAVEKKDAMAKAAETAAQYGLNAAMLACPLTWIVLAIIAVIAVIYLVVAAINKLTDSTYSATGIICGSVMTLVAFVVNTVIGCINAVFQYMQASVEPIIGIVEWILNVCNGGFDSFGGAVLNLVGNIISCFLSLGKVVTTIIDAIFGTNWTDGLSQLQDTVISWGKTEDAITLSREATTIDYRMSYADAWDSGYDLGDGIASSVSGAFESDSLSSFELANSMDSIYTSTAETAENTAALADVLEYSDEELAYLKDIAEREAINRFTTAEIHVEQTNHNNISSDVDYDGIMDAWASDFAEKLEAQAEGVHA